MNGGMVSSAGIGVIVAAAGLVLLSGCAPEPADGGSESDLPSQVHSATGMVREIGEDRRTVVIRHEEIPGYMPRMTMELTVGDTNELAAVRVGNVVTFRLLANRERHWIDTIRRVYGTNEMAGLSQAAPPPDSGARPKVLGAGDPISDVGLLDENGRSLRFTDLRGQAVAFTFIFTRCPLPDFCPRMNRNMSEARRLLRGDPNSPTNWLMLSVSFDPGFDKPAVLRSYANSYRAGDTGHWLFAAAEEAGLKGMLAPGLDLRLAWEGGSIAHNLRTVVLDGQGRIFRQFNGNTWTARDLTNAIVAAAGVR